MEAELEGAISKLEGARDDIRGILDSSDNQTYFGSELWGPLYRLIDIIDDLLTIQEEARS